MTAAGGSPGADYAELKRRVQSAGLFAPQPAYHAAKLALVLSLHAAGWWMAAAAATWGGRLAAALVLACGTVQSGMAMHDAGHRACFRRPWADDAVGLLCGNFLIGIGIGWWVQEHNRHHADPNRDEVDPDIGVPHLAFSAAQLARKPRWLRGPIRAAQAALFLPLLPLQSIYLRAGSYAYLIGHRTRHRGLEIALLIAHWTVYLGLALGLLGVRNGLLFIAAHQALWGFYAGTVFGAGHKGLPLLDPETRLDFLTRQLRMTRNLRPGRLVDAWYGGLNFQIEHHLFPAVSRGRFHQVRAVVRGFCRERGLPYQETGVLRCYAEILGHLARVEREGA
ncbi:MAG: fatty acid desaturase family protein [Thermoanaerobaculia bacterium]